MNRIQPASPEALIGLRLAPNVVRWFCLLFLLLASFGKVSAAFIIVVGDYELAPGLPDQKVELYFSNTIAPQEVAGLDFNLQVADGGPEATGGSVDGPSITNVDLKTNTVFGGVAATQVTAPSLDQVRVESITLDSGTVSVPVASDSSLLMATVTFDTTGFNTLGASWTLKINGTLNGNSQFLDGGANAVAISETAGSISIAAVPEPEAFALVAAGFLVLFRLWTRRSERLDSLA